MPEYYNQCYSDGRHEFLPIRFISGVVTIPILSAGDTGRSLAVDGDRNGEIVLGGWTDDGTSKQMGLSRLLPQGTLDTAFHTDGIRTDDFSAQDDLIHSAISITGATTGYYFAGRGGTADIKYIVGEVKNGGTLDTAFNTDGILMSSIDDTDNIFRGLIDQVLNARQMIAGGYSWINGRWAYTVAAFDTNGNLDSTFNTKGYTHTNMSASDSGALAIGVQASGTPFRYFPVLAGPVMNADWDFGLARYTTDGVLDTGFSTDGTLSISVLSQHDKNYAIAVATSGIFSGGYAYNGANHDFALVRVSSAGVLDTSFHTDGKVTTAFGGGGDDVIFGLGLFNSPNWDVAASKRSVIAVGSTATGANIDIAVAKYQTDGSLDTAFHTDGMASFDIGGGTDLGSSVVSPAATTWFYVGGSSTSSTLDYTVLRLETDGTLGLSGNPIKSFGTTSAGTDLLNPSGGGTDVGVFWNLRGGTFFMVGSAGGDLLLARYSNYAYLDTSFYSDGIRLIDGGATENVYSGFASANDTQVFWVGDDGADFIIAKSDGGSNAPNGDLETSFATDGIINANFSGNDRAFSGGAHSTGSHVVVGRDGATPSNVAVVAFNNATGTLNTAFHTDGLMTFNPTGNASSAKTFYNTGNGASTAYVFGNDTADIFLARLATQGTLDTTFNTTGYKTVDFGGTETMGGARGYPLSNPTRIFFSGGDGSDFFVGKIASSGGAFDTTFHTDGKMTVDFGTVNEVASGLALSNHQDRLYVLGDDGTNILLAVLRIDGALDTTFDTDGKKAYVQTGATSAKSIYVTPNNQICMTGSSNGNVDMLNFCVYP